VVHPFEGTSLIAESVISNAFLSEMRVVLQELRAGCTTEKAKSITEGGKI
jgi:hypothetical protein